MTSLQLVHISKSFQGSETPAVNDIDLSISDGELVAVLGPSGCGKTTMLRMISGFLRPDAGSVIVDDIDVTDTPVHKRDIGMVYQNYALWPHMTVRENVSFGLEMRRLARSERDKRVTETLGLVGLSGLDDRYPTQLSGGQQQRVALARALVIEPKVLLLDEPLASLDANLRDQLRFYIRNLQQELQVTTLFVTHDQEEALAVADRVVLMRDGVIMEVAAGEDLYHNPKSVFAMTFMGDANLVDGVVEEAGADGRGTRVSTLLGSLRCAAGESSDATTGIGSPVRVGIRPDDVTLLAHRDDAPNDGRVVGEVTSRTFLGPWARYEVRVGEVTLQVRVPDRSGDERHTPGTTVLVGVVDGAARILLEV